MLDECCSAAIPESEDTQKQEEEKVVEYKSFLLCEGDLRSCNISSPEPKIAVAQSCVAFHETSLSPANFVYPLFLHDGQDGTPIWAMSRYLGLGGDVDLWKSRSHTLKSSCCIKR
ncbi:uncharacterized protein LOC103942420 [Pyrus x bretschneideri]|uniref:uncharacterized protein LOC103942420 n=1 Tax=Pyrus x bretschneideri TaxID=225117 RepID=UPI00202DE243|nr:uncharacterized protein LOC103942420 [Pyrus x bretschneideri]XP_048433358.1 uncharacterized protein LOC103942420 [Pyrus x bretschneideri]